MGSRVRALKILLAVPLPFVSVSVAEAFLSTRTITVHRKCPALEYISIPPKILKTN